MVEKMKSRKLFAFVVWTILGIILFLTKHNLDTFIPYYGLITSLYIGGQSTIDAIERYKNK